MTQPPRNSYLWQVGLPVYMPDSDDVESVKSSMGFTPTDQILIDAGFWTEEECLAFRVFIQSATSAIDNPSMFVESYRAERAKRDEASKPKSSIIVPDAPKIITF